MIFQQLIEKLKDSTELPDAEKNLEFLATLTRMSNVFPKPGDKRELQYIVDYYFPEMLAFKQVRNGPYYHQNYNIIFSRDENDTIWMIKRGDQSNNNPMSQVELFGISDPLCICIFHDRQDWFEAILKKIMSHENFPRRWQCAVNHAAYFGKQNFMQELLNYKREYKTLVIGSDSLYSKNLVQHPYILAVLNQCYICANQVYHYGFNYGESYYKNMCLYLLKQPFLNLKQKIYLLRSIIGETERDNILKKVTEIGAKGFNHEIEIAELYMWVANSRWENIDSIIERHEAVYDLDERTKLYKFLQGIHPELKLPPCRKYGYYGYLDVVREHIESELFGFIRKIRLHHEIYSDELKNKLMLRDKHLKRLLQFYFDLPLADLPHLQNKICCDLPEYCIRNGFDESLAWLHVNTHVDLMETPGGFFSQRSRGVNYLQYALNIYRPYTKEQILADKYKPIFYPIIELLFNVITTSIYSYRAINILNNAITDAIKLGHYGRIDDFLAQFFIVITHWNEISAAEQKKLAYQAKINFQTVDDIKDKFLSSEVLIVKTISSAINISIRFSRRLFRHSILFFKKHSNAENQVDSESSDSEGNYKRSKIFHSIN